jgi:predicted secreted Zn-dependent protease
MRVLPFLALAVVTLATLTTLALRPAPEGQAVPPSAHGGGSASPVYTIIDVSTYEVGGRTADEILASLVARGPKAQDGDFFGLTETQMAYRYWKKLGEHGCQLEQIRVDLHVAITLPQWTGHPAASPALRREWDTFERSLRRHEDGHREIAEWGAREVYHALRGLRTASCETIDAAAQVTAERLRNRSERRQRSYDRQTGHGRTQDAVWPLGARHLAHR